ncbi:hypothetical protein LOZ55_006630, partial [Ophidiomyces ophidiicola]
VAVVAVTDGCCAGERATAARTGEEEEAEDECGGHRAAREHLHAAQPADGVAAGGGAAGGLQHPARAPRAGAGAVRVRGRHRPGGRLHRAPLRPADRRRHHPRSHGRQGPDDRRRRVPGAGVGHPALARRLHPRARRRPRAGRRVLPLDLAAAAQDHGALLGLLAALRRGQAHADLQDQHRAAAAAGRIGPGHARRARADPGRLECA